MNDNLIELKPVGDLLGMNFFIPNYQRGYSWKEQQVKDLLNDINEFIEQQKKEGFYCIQPLVVKGIPNKDAAKNIRDAVQNKKHSDDKDFIQYVKDETQIAQWEVIDGQQRLTTIYILLSYLYKNLNISGYDAKKYSIEYETRSNSATFLSEIAKKTEADCTNIDFYHMHQAYQTINKWFGGKSNDEKTEFKKTLLNQVKFIWYESTEDDAIKVFTRLNIGKISLTNAELIKALFLNRSNFPEKELASIRLKQQEIASEWDKIEYTLQNDEFWLFLNEHDDNLNKPDDKPTRIDMIFDLVREQDRLEMYRKEKKEEIDEDKLKEACGTDKYKTFRYFYNYFKSRSASIKDCWSKVKDVFQVFEEWYNDLVLYHYVGYLVDQGEKKPEDQAKNIPDLLTLWKAAESKQDFIGKLKEKIKGKLSNCKDLNKEYETSGSPKTQCKPLLLLHNIQTVINQNNNSEDAYKLHVFYKFPFHLYKIEKWDVEHIDSNTENELGDVKSQKEYLSNVYLGVDEETQGKIVEYFNLSDENEQKKKFNDLKSGLPQPSTTMNYEQKNQICNFTLLDSSTNRSYGNSIFPAKRRIIIGKGQGKLIGIPKINKKGKLEFTDEEKAGSSFIPPCTKQVFMKYYSSVSSSPTEYTFEDAEAYRKNIYDTLREFGVTMNNEGGNK